MPCRRRKTRHTQLLARVREVFAAGREEQRQRKMSESMGEMTVPRRETERRYARKT